eukprot:CAMPEP_0116125666 /NCGR_PEP_ID=MMETSP0329-20121206/5930_1 /TAXON_ID=697910 /ORGANISM="Pseudo-nitzschia arenysensis, Strain B593" /LENGTH=468 /DNA_ID=CAMNT_0003619717 /DNA_START=179 /DNA_END=1582 /DNA_ORIENTATION=+
MENKHTKEDVEALMKRLENQFGDVDLDLELLGLGDEEQVTLELEEEEELAHVSQQQLSDPAVAETSQSNTFTDAEAAALMARLGAQFGDLDMSNLGLGAVVAGGGESNPNSNYQDEFGNDSDDESSLEEPTPEELEVWQASQFQMGQQIRKQKQASSSEGIGNAVDSVPQRRKLLRERRAQQLTEEQARLRLQSDFVDETRKNNTDASVLSLLGGDTSTFFGPATANILEELVTEEVDGDSEILQTSWKRLYASYEEGLGFWNLWKALKGYDGPTLLVLRCLPSESKRLEAGVKTLPQTACLGFYTTTPWKDSSDVFGGDIACKDGDKAFLFSIDEKDYKDKIEKNIRFFPVERKLGSKSSIDALKNGYMYCKPSSKNSGDDGTMRKTLAVTGLGVGGRPTQPRFHLTENLEDCSCLTYDSGRVTRDGDLFSCFDDSDPNNSNDKNNAEGHDFAKTLYCFDVIDLEAW